MTIRYTSLTHAFDANCPVGRNPTTCWEWQGLTVGGYGMVRFRGERFLAHRLSYTLHKGPIPVGMQVCHECDNRRCVNPDHLWLGTNKDNMNDKIAKGRQARVKGIQQGQVKLKIGQVYAIRRLARNGVAQQEIAQRFGISQYNVSLIVRYKAWKHLSPPAMDT